MVNICIACFFFYVFLASEMFAVKLLTVFYSTALESFCCKRLQEFLGKVLSSNFSMYFVLLSFSILQEFLLIAQILFDIIKSIGLYFEGCTSARKFCSQKRSLIIKLILR